ncbi:MAG TPA: protealysin inhibitor emfourin, partial [Solirubrobacteraceae bacterium]|nr:protealysin inhibitor emfourin [Solirubrobacteraceae bacterium]
ASPPTALSTRGPDGRGHRLRVRGGGFAEFPGLSRPVRIDTAELAPEQADQPKDLVEHLRAQR